MLLLVRLGKLFPKKLQMVLIKNPGYTVQKGVSDILSGCMAVLPKEFNPHTVSLFKYIAVTYADTERSFSAFKLILTIWICFLLLIVDQIMTKNEIVLIKDTFPYLLGPLLAPTITF